MTHSIKHLFHIDAKREDVYKAISTHDGLKNWWTVQTSGNAEKGGTIQFRFGNYGGPDMKITDLKLNESVSWTCAASNNWEWEGTIITFKLDDNEGKTRVRFSHDGWKENSEMYAICTFGWGRYMESLRQLCQTGKGEAFGSAGYTQ
ncbi:MAG TPA: SRPBCC domain-containing protein [Flavobacteriales bacterium]|nr:SRPBCC domain-containing protein [Flavobacteriales bacterium]